MQGLTHAALAMLTLLALAGSGAAQTPSAEAVAAAVERLEQAFGKGDSAARIEAVRAAQSVPDARVVKWVAKGLNDRDVEVQKATLEGLRFLKHPDALGALHKCYRTDRKLVKDAERAQLLFRAIGQHGSKDSLELLSDDAFSTTENKILQARILAIANIRDRESVEVLMDLMNRAGRQRLQPHMDTFALALQRLTGADHGKSLEAWQKWWNEVKRELEVPAAPPKLSKLDQLRWDKFWGNEQTRERTKRRGSRGDG